MPWHINPNTFDDRMLEWSDAWGDAGPPAGYYSKLGRDHGNAPTFQGSVPLLLETNHSTIPDVGPGRMNTHLMVSRKAKELIESKDPVQHYYIPLELYRKHGARIEGEYFLFQAGDCLDGIVVEKSNAKPVYDEDGRFRYLSAPSRPSITWEAGL